MSDFDRGADAMKSIAADMVASQRSNENEANIRLRIIDRVLTEALGWPHSAIAAEEPSDGGYIDYLVGELGAQFIIEAKRADVGFELPVGLKSGVVSLQPLLTSKDSKDLAAALRQAGGYAQEHGVPVAIAFNGHQLVAYLATRSDGVPPLKGKALVFSSPESFVSDFIVLWNTFSPEGVQSRAIYQTLSITSLLPPEPLSMRLHDYPGAKSRNQLQTSLQILGDLFLGDLATAPELKQTFLEECYASSGALSQYALVSRQILAARYEFLNELGQAPVAAVSNKKGVSTALPESILEAALSNRPIILLGDVGAGKTTFIERLIKVEAKEVLGESVSLYIDLGNSSSLSSISQHVVTESINQLDSKYSVDIQSLEFSQNALRAELARFDKSPMGALKDTDPGQYQLKRLGFIQEQIDDSARYIPLALNWIKKSSRKQIVVFIDNVDQRSADDQDRAFLIANEIAANWPATVFVTLRPETFYSSEREGAISGYHPRVFVISPPRTDHMLQLRLKFALAELNGGRVHGLPAGISIGSDSLETFLEILLYNFETNRPLIELVDNLAGGNMRAALDFVTAFVGSGHINSSKIIERQQQYGSYVIPPHEFMRSIMFGDDRYYDPESSPVPNLFDLSRPDPKEHFLLTFCLAYIQKQGELDSSHGYISSSKVYLTMQGFGFEPEQVQHAIDYAARFKLLDATRRFGSSGVAEAFRITTVGAYAYKMLPGSFTYFDAITVDLPILTEAIRGQVRDVFTMSDRVDRVIAIADYLDAQWADVPTGVPWSWPEASKALRTDLAKVPRSS
jgi:hypothetical protein